MIYTCTYASSLGDILLAADEIGLIGLWFEGQKYFANTLPKEYKVPFAMHVSGFKYREIAEKLNLPLGTVKSRIFFTRQKLQEELKDFR